MVSVSRPFNITTKCASQLIGGNDFVRSGTASASRPSGNSRPPSVLRGVPKLPKIQPADIQAAVGWGVAAAAGAIWVVQEALQ
ncbi:hypothetical protein F2Q68_00018965 [Brassica cretica]|uniref:Uncharacterized protein n=2 Tax=Brassica cretica TaxID=69181 RepID=A0A8S9G2V4_BRACR|nr:hypothetical protein F2Q68_00018965 [Brassica cretica]KAF3565349.1 hypothetical protein DY000_02011518 [Brassica cretica]